MPSFVQKNVNKDFSGANGTTIAVTISAGGAGNLLCGFITAADAVQTCTVADNNGHTATMVPSSSGVLDGGNGNRAWMYYFPNISAAPTTVTATFSVTCPFRGITIIEESGVQTSSPLDQSRIDNVATSTTPTGTAVTTTAAGEFIFAGIVPDSGNPTTILAGTNVAWTLENNSAADVGDEIFVQSSAGSIAGQFRFGTTQASQLGIMTFFAAAATSLPPGKQSFSTPQPDKDAGFPVQLRHWAAPDRLILIGQDKLPPGKQSFQRPIDPQDSFALWRTWTDRYKLTLIGQDRFPPGRQTNYLPLGNAWRPESPPQNLQNTLYTTAPPTIPPGKQLWARGPDPQDPFAQWRSWTQSRNPNLAGQDVFPPGQRSFETPRGPQRGIDFYPGVNIALMLQPPPGEQFFDRPAGATWRPESPAQNLLNTLLAQQALPPGKQLFDLWTPLFDSFARWRFWASFNINLFPPPVKPPGRQLFDLPPYGPQQLPPTFTLFNINLFPPPFVPPPPTFPATYYMLEDHYINENYLPAGTIQRTLDAGGVLPVGWVPNPNVDPVDANAVNAYRAAGYQPRGLSRTQFTPLPVTPPNYVWQFQNGAYVLVKVANFDRNG